MLLRWDCCSIALRTHFNSISTFLSLSSHHCSRAFCSPSFLSASPHLPLSPPISHPHLPESPPPSSFTHSLATLLPLLHHTHSAYTAPIPTANHGAVVKNKEPPRPPPSPNPTETLVSLLRHVIGLFIHLHRRHLNPLPNGLWAGLVQC